MYHEFAGFTAAKGLIFLPLLFGNGVFSVIELLLVEGFMDLNAEGVVPWDRSKFVILRASALLEERRLDFYSEPKMPRGLLYREPLLLGLEQPCDQILDKVAVIAPSNGVESISTLNNVVDGVGMVLRFEGSNACD